MDNNPDNMHPRSGADDERTFLTPAPYSNPNANEPTRISRAPENGQLAPQNQYMMPPQGEYCGSWSGTFRNGIYSGTGDYLGKTMPFYLTQIQ